jgi:hypothetical protein
MDAREQTRRTVSRNPRSDVGAANPLMERNASSRVRSRGIRVARANRWTPKEVHPMEAALLPRPHGAVARRCRGGIG